MKKVLVIMLASFLAAAAWAQSPVATVQDGSIGTAEYSVIENSNGFTVAARLSPDMSTLHVAVSGQTTGWIAIGLGSLKMNGAFMILGYVEAGKPSVSFELGKGYSHAPTPAPGAQAAVFESNGSTTLEASVPAAGYVKNGSLELIAAWGSRDDFKSKHAKRTVLTVKL